LGEFGVDCVLIGGVAAYSFPIIKLEKLILAKRAAGRPKDLLAIPELEAILEQQTKWTDDTAR